MLRALALVVAATCILLPSIAVCDAAIVSAGERIRFMGPGHVLTEATVLSSAGDTIVVQYDVVFYPPVGTHADTVWLGSLEWLEVRLKPASMLSGVIVGAALGALTGSAVAGLTTRGNRNGEYFIPVWRVCAPVGAVVGGGLGLVIAHDRGMRWKRIPLPRR
jgi:hypothetical protein